MRVEGDAAAQRSCTSNPLRYRDIDQIIDLGCAPLHVDWHILLSRYPVNPSLNPFLFKTRFPVVCDASFHCRLRRMIKPTCTLPP